MSLFKKNVPLKEEEEVAVPVMHEYTGQHPMLSFKSVSAIVKPDHLDQYMEVRPFESSEPKIKVKDFDTKFGTKRDKKTTQKLRSKIKITDGKIEKSLNDFIQNVVFETPGIICHKTTIRESILRSKKEVKRPSIPDYYFFPQEINVSVTINEGEEISIKRLEEGFYQNRLLFRDAYKWIVDKKVNM